MKLRKTSKAPQDTETKEKTDVPDELKKERMELQTNVKTWRKLQTMQRIIDRMN